MKQKINAQPNVGARLKKAPPAKVEPLKPKKRLSRVDRAVLLATYFCNANEQKRKAKLRNAAYE